MKTLAIISPSNNSYSETFIRAHKLLPFNIKFYYGGWLPNHLEGNNTGLLNFSILQRIRIKWDKSFSVSEHAFGFSLKKQKIDCVLAEYGPTACGCLKVVETLNIPMVVHFHGFDARRKVTIEEYSECYKKIFMYAYRIIAVSKQMKQDLIELGCSADKIIVSVCGPNRQFFEIRPDYLSRQFAAVGRFTHKKAPHLTIQAFNKVAKKMSSLKLVMAGDGELLDTCKNLAEQLGLSEMIEFTGVLTPDEIKTLFSSSAAFVQHSLVAESGDSEGTPVAVLEAQAAALPVISTFHAGIPDVVIDNETGLLVKENDVEAMSNNMLRIISEQGLAEKLGIAGRERVKENFTLEMHLKTLGQVINDAIIH